MIYFQERELCQNGICLSSEKGCFKRKENQNGLGVKENKEEVTKFVFVVKKKWRKIYKVYLVFLNGEQLAKKLPHRETHCQKHNASIYLHEVFLGMFANTYCLIIELANTMFYKR